MSHEVAPEQVIQLKGSGQQVAEFFSYAVNSILHLRGVYPAEKFKCVQTKFGFSVMVVNDKEISSYIEEPRKQAEEWVAKNELERIILDIHRAAHPYEVVERWTFAVEADKQEQAAREGISEQEETLMKKGMAVILKQVHSGGAFFPPLPGPCVFVPRFVVKSSANASKDWEDAALKEVANAQHMKMGSFSTKVHKLDSMVTFTGDDDYA